VSSLSFHSKGNRVQQEMMSTLPEIFLFPLSLSSGTGGEKEERERERGKRKIPVPRYFE
jgi:hypothetical protein